MILGNGLIARSLAGIDNDQTLFFCSGVSDSGEQRTEAYDREANLFLDQPEYARIVYFSTLSVHNEHSLYTSHKRVMEGLATRRGAKIIRLPIVYGPGGNPANLINFLIKSARQGRVTLHTEARRFLLHSSQLVTAVTAAIYVAKSMCVDVCGHPDALPVTEIGILLNTAGFVFETDYTPGGVSHRARDPIVLDTNAVAVQLLLQHLQEARKP